MNAGRSEMTSSVEQSERQNPLKKIKFEYFYETPNFGLWSWLNACLGFEYLFIFQDFGIVIM